MHIKKTGNGKFPSLNRNYLICVLLLFGCLIWRRVCLNAAMKQGKVKTKIDYIARFNEISKPRNYDPNLNAAPYYRKAFDLFVTQPNSLSELDLEKWPEDIAPDKKELLNKWILDNGKAIEQLKLGVHKPYNWTEHKGNSLWEFDSTNLAGAKGISLVLCSEAKLAAAKNKFEEAFSDLLICYRFSNHFTGKRLLLDQLLVRKIVEYVVNCSLQVLTKTHPDVMTLKEFEDQIEKLSSRRGFVADFTLDKFNQYDCIEKLFTDDGMGNGHIYGTRNNESQDNLRSAFGSDFCVEMVELLARLDKKRTRELVDVLFDYINKAAQKRPWFFSKEVRNRENLAKDILKNNTLVEYLSPNFRMVIESSWAAKSDVQALVTVLGLVRYAKDKGVYPKTLEQLLSEGYIEELPVDPYSAGSLIYKPTNNDFTLYSVGSDFDDDGGKPSYWGKGKQGGDQVFWPVQTK